MVNTFGGDYARGLTNSALYSIPELFGFKPPAEQQLWEAQHPYASFGASMVVDAVPYAGWFAATSKLKSLARFDKFVNAIGNANKAPFVTGALRTATRFAPLEAARVGVNAAFGDTPNSEMLTSALTNSLVGGFLGGAGEWLMAGGVRPKRVASFSGLDETKPVQLQIRALDDHITKGGVDPEILAKLQNHRANLASLARVQELDPTKDLYVGGLEGSSDPRLINRLFVTSEKEPTKTLLRKRLVGPSARDFPDEATWRATVDRAGLAPDFEKYAQFPRYVAFHGDKAAASASQIEHSIANNMQQIGDNWFLAREKNDGMFVLAKKFNGAVGNPAPSDEWLVLKTDRPDFFAQKATQWLDAQFKRNLWAVEPKSANADLGTLGNTVKEFSDKLPLNNYMALMEANGLGAKGVGKIKKIFGLGDSTGEMEFVARAREFMRDYVAPRMFQFNKNPRAVRIMSLVQQAMDAAESLSDKTLFGKYQRPKQGGNLLLESIKGRPELNLSDSIKELHDAAAQNPKNIHTFWELWNAEAKDVDVLAAFANGKLDEAGLKYVQALRKLNDEQVLNIQKLQKALDKPELEARIGHFGISRTYEGDQLIPITDQGGTLKAIASGYNARHAQRVADELLKKNPNWIKSQKVYNRSDLANAPKELQLHVNNPTFMQHRLGIKGYKYSEEPWTAAELLKELEDGIRWRNKYQAELASQEVVRQDLEKLYAEDPAMGRAVVTRMNDFFGKQRPMGQMVNATVDRVLGPMLGKNSASRIAATTNNLLWHFDLGGMRIGYIITQALSPIQTVLPEIAFVLNGTPARLAGYYDTFAAGGTKGPVGTLSALSPIKIAARAMREMRSPDAALFSTFEKAVNERVVNPRLVEEFVGESATRIRDLRAALGSSEGFVGWLRSVSEFLPAQAERFSRAYALTTGHIVGRDFLQLQGDELYRFAKQFTHKTSYLYSAADRSGMFVTPAGTVFGQFKNWMMHYMYSMLDYTGEGFTNGNWSPLLWQQAGTWAIGGLAASPLINVASTFNNVFSDKSLIENTYDAFSTRAADGIFYGLPAILTGLSLSSQTSTPLANPARDAEMLYSFVLFDRMKLLGQAMGAAFDTWAATGDHPAKNTKYRDMMIQALAPKSIYRTMQVLQDENINSLRSGYPIVKSPGMFDKIAYAAGLPTTALERTYAISDMLWKEKEARIAEVQNLGELYAQAQSAGDWQSMNVILRKAQIEGIASSVVHSAASRQGKAKQGMLERNFGADALIRFRDMVLN